MQVLAPQFEVKKFNENIYFDALFFLNDLKLDISVISIFSFIQLETTNEEFIKNLANIELLDCDERKVSVFNLQEVLYVIKFKMSIIDIQMDVSDTDNVVKTKKESSLL